MAERPRVVLMGVAGSGKSTVGPRLAAGLDVPFVDADDLHSETDRARMAAGTPLDDAARGPWLDRVHAVLAEATTAGRGVVVACSALKSTYRARLAAGLPGVAFVALVVPAPLLEARLEDRAEHFAGPSLLTSQLHDLELDDGVVRVDASQPVEDVVDAAIRAVRATSA